MLVSVAVVIRATMRVQIGSMIRGRALVRGHVRHGVNLTILRYTSQSVCVQVIDCGRPTTNIEPDPIKTNHNQIPCITGENAMVVHPQIKM